MAKVKKMAGGGLLTGLGSLLSNSSIFGDANAPQSPAVQQTPQMLDQIAGSGGTAQQGLGQVQNGASTIAESLGTASSALDAANNAIGGSGAVAYKKGGSVSYTTKGGRLNLGSGRVSTSQKNSKQPKW